LQEALRSLERSNDELQRSKSIAEAANLSKTTFLSSLSHDLLQPLNAARLAASALAEIEAKPEAESFLGQINRALATLEDLIRTLLDISKLDAGVLKPEPCPFALAGVIEPLAQAFAPAAARKQLQLRVHPTDAQVVTDPLLLQRILQNLLSNALRYTRQGGVLLACRNAGDHVRIAVVDTGPGIPPERREAIFEEFRRYDAGDDGQAGFGLGLAIVRRLALAMHHPISITSRVGRGSVFSVLVPRYSGPPLALPKPASGRVPHYGLRDATVLLIENEPAVAEAMETLLARWGCSVVTAISPADAIARLSNGAPQPELIIADLHLGAGNMGYDAIDAVRLHAGREVPAFIVTADHSAGTEAEMARRGFELLRKPVKPAALRALVAHLLA
jgi:CheY-like chemotaxis protein